MTLPASLIKGLVCYLLSFALMLYFIGRSKTNLVEKEQLEYGRSISFYVKASEKTADHFILTQEMAKWIEERLAFRVNAGSVFQTSTILVNPQKVTWKSGKVSYTVAGGLITFNGKLTAAADPAHAEQPLVIVLPDLPEGQWAFPNGGARGAGSERLVKNFHVYPDAAAVQSANQSSAAADAGSLALVGWGVWLIISAWWIRRKRDAASEPPEQVQLPRVFAPNVPNIARSFGLAAVIGGFVALILTAHGMEGTGGRKEEQVALMMTGAAFAVALLVGWFSSRRIVGAEVSSESLVLTRGRGHRREIPWSEITAAKLIEIRNASGHLRREYFDLVVQGKAKPLRIHPTHIAEFPLFRALVSALWEHKHPAARAVS